MNSTSLIILIVLSIGASTGCQVDTTKDNVQRSRDRDREMAKTLEADYSIVSGDYETRDDSPAKSWIKFHINVVKDLKLQPSLSGVVFFADKSLMQSQARPADADLLKAPISQGVYDPPSRTMILNLAMGDGSTPIVVNCDMTVPERIPCVWKPSTMKQPFEFLLRKLP